MKIIYLINEILLVSEQKNLINIYLIAISSKIISFNISLTSGGIKKLIEKIRFKNFWINYFFLVNL
ncbi:hypothetical protein BpHYR1_044427 [Brachionus plicatilis]|uniref:Uncharacterized protein n=1 Tax=Brachionus plicatilis TaxID=10195 RepID=A0A3M7QAG0_BRAPC|nr:hypothetical protein BpHYR1_044427 [Brachionus plicatilis]